MMRIEGCDGRLRFLMMKGWKLRASRDWLSQPGLHLGSHM